MNSQQELIQINNNVPILNSSENQATFDVQIATAKRYPRNLNVVKNNALQIITMDKETAECCRYALPRAGKTISGASVHLARILSQSYGNIRVQARLKDVGQTTVTAEAICFDLENNYAVSVEVSRSIVGKTGRYNNDMINTTGLAACAIAFRNAVFSVIPKSLTDICYNKALEIITGDLSDETKIIQARAKSIQYFIDKCGVTKDDVIAMLGLRSENQIGQEQIIDLRGIAQALKDGEKTADEIFPKKPEKKESSMAELKAQLVKE